MTTVDFRLDEASLEEDLRQAPERADAAAMEETYFVMPVRLCVNGVDLLEQPSRTKRNEFIGAAEHGVQQIKVPNEASCWLPLPVLGFATGVLQTLNEISPGREKKLYLAGGGHLVFARQADRISVQSSFNEKSSSTELLEALNAFRAFSDQVRQMLVSRIPTIQRHPSWKQWFA